MSVPCAADHDLIYSERSEAGDFFLISSDSRERGMSRYEHLPIYKEAFDLALYFEKTVRGMSLGHNGRNSMRFRTSAGLKTVTMISRSRTAVPIVIASW